MLIKALQNFISEHVPDGTAGKVYQVPDAFGQHLIDTGIGAAVKIEEPAPLVKREAAPPSSASQAAPVSHAPTATPRKGRPPKSLRSTTAGE